MTGWRHGGVLRGALGIALAYALFLHVLVAGFVAERMAFSPLAGVDVLCLGEAGSAPSDEHRPAPPGISHCIICIFAKLTPVVGTAEQVVEPARNYGTAFAAPRQETGAPRLAWRVPRLSQGPPDQSMSA